MRPGADCQSTLACLRGSASTSRDGAGRHRYSSGTRFGRLRSPAGPLDAGNSGTTMRLLAGMLAGQPFSSTLVGDASLSRRPMRRVIEPLERMGARIEATDGHAAADGSRRARCTAIAHRPEVPSAQVKSAVLLAGLHAEGTTTRRRAGRRRATTPSARSRPSAGRSTRRRADRVGRRAASGCTGRTLLGARRLLLRRVLAGRGGGAAGLARRDRGRRPQPDAHGAARRAAPVRRARRGRGRPRRDAGEPRGTIVVEGDRTGRSTSRPTRCPA